MRLFIALDCAALHEYFASLQKEIQTAGATGTLPKAFHVTLKFLGEVEEKKVAQIKEALQSIVFESLSLHLSHIGVFPSENYVRVVWVGVEPQKPVLELQQQIEEKLKPLGFPVDKRFHPHITLARVKFVKDKEAFAEALKKIKVEGKEFQVKEFKLIQSILSREGAEYRDVAVLS